jgi:hypothetical protein
MPSRKKVVAVNIRIAGMPSANMTSTAPPLTAISGCWPSARRMASPGRSSRPNRLPKTAPLTSASRQIRPHSAGRPAPSVWAVSTTVPISRPMPTSRNAMCGAKAMP